MNQLVLYKPLLISNVMSKHFKCNSIAKPRFIKTSKFSIYIYIYVCACECVWPSVQLSVKTRKSSLFIHKFIKYDVFKTYCNEL